MIQLKEAFRKFIKDEFPPKQVFCMYNQVVYSIELKELEVYAEKYKFIHRDNPYKLPVLALI